MTSLSLATSGNVNRLPSGNQTWQLEIRHYSGCSINTSMDPPHIFHGKIHGFWSNFSQENQSIDQMIGQKKYR
jgi:hypothetical protein